MSYGQINFFFEGIRRKRILYYEKYDNKIKQFINNINFRLEIFKDFKNEIDRYLAIDFNVFDYIGPDENRLSDILADLLNPRGKHGQGNLFLNNFMNIINVIIDTIASCDINNAKVGREETTNYIIKSNRRIDITIDFEQRFAVGIENKPWAPELPDQLKDYKSHLESKYRDNYILVFIPGDPSTEPQTLGNEIEALKRRKKVITMSYPNEIKNWLASCHKDCNSEKIRWFLHDFIRYIETNFQPKLA